MQSVRGLAAALILLCLAPGPARAAAPVTDAGAGDLSARVGKIERLLEGRALVDMLAQIEALQQEVARLRGELELQTHTLGKMRDAQKGQYEDLDERLRRLETGIGAAPVEPDGVTPPADANPPLQTLAPTAPGSEPAADGAGESALTVELVEKQPAVAAPASDTAPPTVAPPETAAATEIAAAAPAQTDAVRERDDYQQAFKLLKQSLYDQAIEAFREFLAVYPAGEYADNAQYWLGEAYFVTRQYENALAEYQALAGKYPNSQKLPDALLKIAYSYEELGKDDEARRELTDLRQRFPGTTAARLADERLKTLGGRGTAAPPN